MKIVKFLEISVMMLVLCIGFSSCSDDSYESRIHELLIDSKKLVFEATEDEGELVSTLTFRGEDVSHYKANPDAEWCTVYFTDSTSTMTIKVTNNDTFDERKSTVTILDTKDGVSSRTFVVTQKQNNVIRLVDGEGVTYQVSTDGGQVVVNLESNVSYTVQIPSDVDWITLPGASGTRGLQQSQVVLQVARNTTEKTRSAQVVIKDETSGAMQIILVTQLFQAYLKVAEKSFTVDELGGEIAVNIETNISFDFYTTPEDAWVKKKGNRETINDNTVCQKVYVYPFTDKAPERTSSLSVENASFGFQYTIKITQTRNLYIQESSIKILTGASQKLTLYNADNEAVYWETEDEKIATVDDEGNVTGVGAGVTIVKVFSSDGVHTDNVSVTVEKPADLKDKIQYQWQPYFTPFDDVSVLTKLSCALTNNSEYDLMVTKVTLYSDNVVLTSAEPQGDAGKWAIGKEFEFKADIPVEYEEDTVEEQEVENEDGTITMVPVTIPGKAKENTHQYLLVVEYKHSSETFSYMCYYPELTPADESSDGEKAAARKKAVRKNRRR